MRSCLSCLRVVTQAGVDRLCEWLQPAKFLNHGFAPPYTRYMCVSLRCKEDNPDLMRAQLQVLRAINLVQDKRCYREITVRLNGWPLTHTAMELLQGLPHWQVRLDLTGCTWPLEDKAQYKRLAQCVPTSYEVWDLDMGRESPVCEALCAGLNERRVGMSQPVALVVREDEYELPQMVGEHVRVEVYREPNPGDYY